MVESMAATSLLGHCPVLGLYSKDVSRKQVRVASTCFPRSRGIKVIRAQAMELTKEVSSDRVKNRSPQNFYEGDTAVVQKPGLWPPNNKADDPSLHNPLLRLERMGCGWLGAIFELEGVLIEDNPDLEQQAWVALSQEEGRSPPSAFMLRKLEGMKTEQAISQVLCWSRDPSELRRLAARKEEIYQGLQGGFYRFRDGTKEFLNVLMTHNIPMAIVSTRPRSSLEEVIGAIGMEGALSAIVASEDISRGKPDPEMYEYAAQLLKFKLLPERCIVFGNSNLTVEAAHDAKMKCVAVASKHPVYELTAADLVVRRLDELAVVDLKSLVNYEPELEPEPELERIHTLFPETSVMDM